MKRGVDTTDFDYGFRVLDHHTFSTRSSFMEQCRVNQMYLNEYRKRWSNAFWDRKDVQSRYMWMSTTLLGASTRRCDCMLCDLLLKYNIEALNPVSFVQTRKLHFIDSHYMNIWSGGDALREVDTRGGADRQFGSRVVHKLKKKKNGRHIHHRWFYGLSQMVHIYAAGSVWRSCS